MKLLYRYQHFSDGWFFNVKSLYCVTKFIIILKWDLLSRNYFYSGNISISYNFSIKSFTKCCNKLCCSYQETLFLLESATCIRYWHLVVYHNAHNYVSLTIHFACTIITYAPKPCPLCTYLAINFGLTTSGDATLCKISYSDRWRCVTALIFSHQAGRWSGIQQEASHSEHNTNRSVTHIKL